MILRAIIILQNIFYKIIIIIFFLIELSAISYKYKKPALAAKINKSLSNPISYSTELIKNLISQTSISESEQKYLVFKAIFPP